MSLMLRMSRTFFDETPDDEDWLSSTTEHEYYWAMMSVQISEVIETQRVLNCWRSEQCAFLLIHLFYRAARLIGAQPPSGSAGDPPLLLQRNYRATIVVQQCALRGADGRCCSSLTTLAYPHELQWYGGRPRLFKKTAPFVKFRCFFSA
jgi:hypothetical protein